MSSIVRFPGGGGPEDMMLEQRVAALEAGVSEVKSSLKGIEVMLAEMKGQLSQMPKMSDYAALKADIAEVKGKLSNLPTTLTLLGIVFTTWAIGSGILIFAMNFLRR